MRTSLSTIAVAATVILGLTLRLTGLGVHSLWFDETMTVHLATHDHIIDELRRDRNPPLSFLLFRLWIGVFGSSDVVLRLLPALISCFTFLLIALGLPRLISRNHALTTTLILAVSPFSIWYGQEVRTYALVELGSCLQLLALLTLRAKSDRPIGHGLLLFAGSAIAIGSNYTGQCLLYQSLPVAAYLAWKRRGHPYVIAYAAIASLLVWAPWLVAVFPDQLNNGWGKPDPVSLRKAIELPVRLLLMEPDATRWVPSLWFAIGAVVAAHFGFLYELVRRPTRDIVIQILLLLCPLVGCLAVSILLFPQFESRYVIAAELPFALLVARGALAFGRFSPVILLPLLSGLLVLSLSHKTENLREDFRAAFAEVVANWRDGDKVTVITGTFPGFSEAPALHYLQDHPDILSALCPESILRSRVPAGARIHAVYRDASYAWPSKRDILDQCIVLHQSPMRFKVQYLLLAAER